MKRTIIKQNQSYTLTLPKQWVEQHNLKRGQEIELTSENGDLIITSTSQGEKKKSVYLSQCNKSLVRSVIASAYKAGYTEITLTFGNQPSFNDIYSIANSFTGLEVVSQAENTIVLKSFLSTKKEEVENLVVKLFQIATHTSKVVWEDWNSASLPDLLLLKENARKLRDHTLRVINGTNFGGEKSYDYYDFVTQLEKTVAELYILAWYVTAAKPNKSSFVSTLLDNVQEIYAAYLKKEFSAAQTAWEHAHKLTKQIADPKNKNILLLRAQALANSSLHLASRLLSLVSEVASQDTILSGGSRR